MSRNWLRDLMPECAVCGKTVERIEACENYRDGGWDFQVSCHGQTETTFLSRVQLSCLAPDLRGLEPYKAFTTKALPTANLQGDE